LDEQHSATRNGRDGPITFTHAAERTSKPKNAKVSSTLTAGEGKNFSDADSVNVNAVAAVLAESSAPMGLPALRASHLTKVDSCLTRHALNYLSPRASPTDPDQDPW
jgi:hypothetical protein